MRPLTLLMLWLPALAVASPGEEAALELLDSQANGLFGEPVTRSEQWWSGYDDPGLNHVLESALAHNPEMGSAWDRVELARAMTQQSAAALMPVAQFQVTGNVSPTNTMGFGVFSSIMPDMGDYFGEIADALNAMGTGPGGEPLIQFPEAEVEEEPNAFLQGAAVVNLSLPIDLMGQHILNWRASRHEAQAAEGSKQAQALALATMTAEAYYNVLAARHTATLITSQVDNQQDLLDLVELSFQNGAARSTDVLQQRQQLAAAQARLPAARQGEVLATEALRRLIGGGSPTIGEKFPKLGAAPPLGDAAGLLQNRPDLGAAAHSFDAARLQKLAATRSYGPSIALNGQVGWQYYQFNEFDSIKTWGAGASASLPVFSGGRIASGVRAARANESAAKNSLRGAALTVLQEVRSTSLADASSEEQLRAVLRQQEAAHAAYEEARAQYQRGVTSYIQVLPILIASQSADLTAIEARRQRMSARIQLHDALGGTWPSNGVKP